MEKENITIDKTEFIFQLKSHPNRGTLLAINDALTFFNIDNLAARISKTEVDDLPDRFVAFLSGNLNHPEPYFIERKGEKFFFSTGKNMQLISKEELKSRWGDIVLLLNKVELDEIKKNEIKYIAYSPFLLVIFLLIILLQSQINLQEKLFIIFPIAGILLSFVAVKELFNVKSELISKFCNMTGTTSCTTVIGSTKWKFFEIVNFSDLSIVFFSSQFIGVIMLLLFKDSSSFFTIQKALLLCSIPFVVISLYYQKFVESKWCPICLLIIGIILLELGYIYTFQDNQSISSIVFIFSYCFVVIAVIFSWTSLKSVLQTNKDLKELQISNNQFIRNYDMFKNCLLSKEEVNLTQDQIIIGNKYSKTKITLISNPFCGHCKETHYMIDKLLNKYDNEIQVELILKTDFKTESEDKKKLFRSLITIYVTEGEIAFLKSLKSWFDEQNLEKWLRSHSIVTTTEFDYILESQNNWCEVNEYNFTPVIFINGYEYPYMYERKNLVFFIDDIMEDDYNFQNMEFN